MKNDYVPSTDGDALKWAQNLSTQTGVGANATAMGWDNNVAGQVQGQANLIAQAMQAKTDALAAYKAAVATAGEQETTALGIIRARVATGKRQTTYTNAVGVALGVVGTNIPFDPTTYVAELRGLRLMPGPVVEVSFGKASGDIDGVNVYMRRVGQNAWTDLGLFLSSPALDATPLAAPGVPEVRQYYVAAVIGNSIVGQPSQPQQITVS